MQRPQRTAIPVDPAMIADLKRERGEALAALAENFRDKAAQRRYGRAASLLWRLDWRYRVPAKIISSVN